MSFVGRSPNSSRSGSVQWQIIWWAFIFPQKGLLSDRTDKIRAVVFL